MCVSVWVFFNTQGQCTEEQKAKWLRMANEYKIIGTYVQTELGHGKCVVYYSRFRLHGEICF